MCKTPENLQELYTCIVEQLEKTDSVTINMADGDSIYELLASILDGIDGTRKLNRMVLLENAWKAVE